MKVKTKLIASIMSICLVCAVFAIGVFALKTANLKIGGDVSFSATGVEADIKNVTLTGATTNDQVLATGSINTSMTQADIDTTFQNWQSLELDFDEEATDIELKFDIANTSTNADNYIEIDYSYSFSNSSPNVDVFPGDENAQNAWENNEYILAPKGSAANATYETFTLKFKVIDKELNVPQDTKVSVNIELKHVTPVSATGVWNFVANSPKAGEATLQRTSSEVAYTTPENWNGVLEIPAVITDGTNNYIVTKLYSAGGIEADPQTTFIVPSNTKQVIFHNSLKEIEGCIIGVSVNGVDTIELPISLTKIGVSAFWFCSSLASVTIPNSVTSIGVSAFQDCSSLTAITIPSSVTSIGNSAFPSCSSLTSITIPSSVTSIGGSAFNNTPWYNNQPDGLVYINNVLYKYKGTMPAGTSIEVKEGTVSISPAAFSGCTGLSSIIIPSSVTSIGVSAFSSCTNLTSVKFEETTGWAVANSADGERTPIAESEFTTDASAANANLLKSTYSSKYWFRTVA